MTGIRVACVQLRIDVEQPTTAGGALQAAIADAAARGARLIVLPELANSGYHFTDLAEATAAAEEIPGPWTHKLQELSDEHGVVIVSGIAERDGPADRPALYSSAVVVDRGRVVGRYRKTHLWDQEHRFFSPGDQPILITDTSVGRVAVAVCYDIEFPEMARRAAEGGADIIAAPVNWPLLPRPEGLWPIEVAKAMAHAAEYRIPIAVADRCGSERGQKFIGGSVIVGCDGYPLAGPRITSEAEPQLLITDVELISDRRLSEFNDALGDRRPELY